MTNQSTRGAQAAPGPLTGDFTMRKLPAPGREQREAAVELLGAMEQAGARYIVAWDVLCQDGCGEFEVQVAVAGTYRCAEYMAACKLDLGALRSLVIAHDGRIVLRLGAWSSGAIAELEMAFRGIQAATQGQVISFADGRRRLAP